MADLKQLTLAGTALDVPTALNDLTDVNAPSPVAGQVLTCGDGGIWSPQANQAAGFPGLDALKWVDVNTIATPLTNPPTSNWPKIAKFQNVVFCKFGEGSSSTVLKDELTSTRVNSFRLPNGYFNANFVQTFLLDETITCRVEIAGAVWFSTLAGAPTNNSLRGLAHWYV